MPAPEAPAIQGQPTHRCARCRLTFPLEPADDAQGAADWWLCAPCHAILLPDRKR